MSTKMCPKCENSVPAVANLCKHCSHDFHTPEPRTRSPWLPLAAVLFGTGLVAIWAFSTQRDSYKRGNVFLDEEAKRVVFVTTYPDRHVAEQVAFDDVAGLEYVQNGSPHPYELSLVTTKDKRFTLGAGPNTLDAAVRTYETAFDKRAVVKGDLAEKLSK